MAMFFSNALQSVRIWFRSHRTKVNKKRLSLGNPSGFPEKRLSSIAMNYSYCCMETFYKFNKMVMNVNIPIIVVNIPVLFDLVQPDNAIKTDNVIIPTMKAANPTILGKFRSLFSNLRGYPSVVIITILVIEKTVIKKQAAATVVTFNKLFEIFFSDFATNKLAMTAMENPLKSELITIN